MRDKFQASSSRYSAQDRIDFWQVFLTYFGFYVAGHLVAAYGLETAIKALSLAVLGLVVWLAPVLQALANRMLKPHQRHLKKSQTATYLLSYAIAPLVCFIGGLLIG